MPARVAVIELMEIKAGLSVLAAQAPVVLD
jgi:hypothetical protein